MRRFLTPGWLASHVFVAVMVVVLVALGFWQLRRLDERRDRNDDVRAAMDAQPVDIATAVSEDAPDHTPVIVHGEYLDDRSFLVANRSYDAQAGAWLVTPVRLADGDVVAVARGWVPRLWTAGRDPRVVETPRGEVEIRGRLHASVSDGRIGSGDTATLPEISRLDLDRVEELLAMPVVDRWVQLEQPAPAAAEIPVPVPPPGLDEGPHLSYAFQWFFFATGTVVAYVLIIRRQRAEPAADG